MLKRIFSIGDEFIDSWQSDAFFTVVLFINCFLVTEPLLQGLSICVAVAMGCLTVKKFIKNRRH